MSSLMQMDDFEELVAASNEEGLLPSTVKLKLNTFLKEQHSGSISMALNTLVIEMNKLMGEAYLFGNFHASRLLKTGAVLPQVDRNFYYRCLLSVGKNKCVETTLTAEWVESIRQFDAFRPKHPMESLVAQPRKGRAKVSVIGRVQLIADLSILMSTMASNHLWMNLESRLSTYIRWKYPNMSKSNQKSIVVALVKARRRPLTAFSGQLLSQKSSHRGRSRRPKPISRRPNLARRPMTSLARQWSRKPSIRLNKQR